MKVWIVVLICAVLGAAGGAGATYLEFRDFARDPVLLAAGNDLASQDRPKLYIDSERFDFGSMEQGETRSHSFTVMNTGGAPLELSKLTTTCKCTIGDFGKNKLDPGESTKITLEWTANTSEGNFRQEATIRTNDPTRPMLTLTVHGNVTFSHRVVPERIVFDGVSPSSGRTAIARIGSAKKDNLEITGYELLNKETAEFFDVAIAKIPAEELFEDTTSGQLITIKAKPGLPLEPIRQTLKLTTNLENAPTIELPIEGIVRSDITIAGRGFLAAANKLTLGHIRSDEGAKAELKVIVRGPHRKDVNLKVASKTPEDALVTLGEPVHQTNVTLIPLTIEIPKGARSGNYLGSQQGKMGEIHLETGHPHTKEMTIYLSMLIEG